MEERLPNRVRGDEFEWVDENDREFNNLDA